MGFEEAIEIFEGIGCEGLSTVVGDSWEKKRLEAPRETRETSEMSDELMRFTNLGANLTKRRKDNYMQ
jgi:hypothetical protein